MPIKLQFEVWDARKVAYASYELVFLVGQAGEINYTMLLSLEYAQIET